jgi:hypothetical protein
MKNLVTFALTTVKESPTMNFLNRIADEVKPGVAHTVGGVSGATGWVLWSDLARHLTVFMGLFVALMAGIGGMFYATYWAIKALREWKALRASDIRARRR